MDWPVLGYFTAKLCETNLNDAIDFFIVPYEARQAASSVESIIAWRAIGPFYDWQYKQVH